MFLIPIHSHFDITEFMLRVLCLLLLYFLWGVYTPNGGGEGALSFVLYTMRGI